MPPEKRERDMRISDRISIEYISRSTVLWGSCKVRGLEGLARLEDEYLNQPVWGTRV